MATPPVNDKRPIDASRRLIESTRDLDYDPSQEAWICGPHGIPECPQGDCPNLPWPTPNTDPILAAFTTWADNEFARTVRPYDRSNDPQREMPEEAFRAYSLWEWPLGAFLEIMPSAVSATPATQAH